MPWLQAKAINNCVYFTFASTRDNSCALTMPPSFQQAQVGQLINDAQAGGMNHGKCVRLEDKYSTKYDILICTTLPPTPSTRIWMTEMPVYCDFVL